MNVFLTGASSGLGQALCQALLARGDTVWACSRRTMPSTERLYHVCADLNEESSAKPALQNLLLKQTRLDLVILNAGVLGPIRDLRESRTQELKAVMEVNLWANKWLLDDVVFFSGRRVSQVVAISSGAARRAYRGWGGYCLSKAALDMLMELEAVERPETHFVSLAPGLVDTAMQEHLTSLPPDAPYGNLDKLRQARSSGNMPKPAEAAANILRILPRLRELPSGSRADVRDFAPHA